MTTSGDPPTGDPRYELLFREAEKALARQDSALGNLRDRAAALLSTATVLTTVAPAVGLISSDPGTRSTMPGWLSFAIVIVVVAIGACAVMVLLPRDGWVFTNDVQVLADDWIGARNATIDDMHRNLALHMRVHEADNDRMLMSLYGWYRAGVVLLILQTGLLVVGFTTVL